MSGAITVAAAVLAAGASRRMGRPKPLLAVGGGTLLAAAVAPLIEAGVSRIVVVLGCEAEAVRSGAGLPAVPGLEVVVNPAWSEGMASSLRCGLEACADAGALLVALGDQPGVRPELIRGLLAAARDGAVLALPVHEGRAGHPVLFGRALFGELRALQGDVGGREVVRRHWSEAVRLEAEPLRDVDTPEDYRALLEGGGSGEG